MVSIIVGYYFITYDTKIHVWINFYKWFIFITFGWSIFATELLIIGGLRDLKNLFTGLKYKVIDTNDDGQIHE